ncbi:hypothetical protein DFH11DRAFT_254678 [Phellopilus nigrolimitatus]|nr:hypothetical protein DFH11DRAFT_254678 [Phellopilus nigrolimitatus]
MMRRPDAEPRAAALALSSPCLPSTQHSSLPPDPPRVASGFLNEHFANATVVAEKDLVLIKTFVHEVLRRSRKTCSVLQSALCYRSGPEGGRARREGKARFWCQGEPELGDRIMRDSECLVVCE